MLLNGCSFCFIKDYVYLVDWIFPMLFRWKKNKSLCEFVCELPNSEQSLPYIDVVACGQFIICIPCTTSDFVIYDTITGELKTMDAIELLRKNNVNFISENFLFNFATVFDNRVIAFGAGADCVVSILPYDESVEVHKSLMNELRPIAPKGVAFYRRDFAIVNDNIFLASSFDGSIFRINLRNFSFEIYNRDATVDCIGNVGLAFYDNSLWLFQKNGFIDKYELQGTNISERKEHIKLVPDDNLPTGRFFAFGKNLIYLNEKNRNAYIYSIDKKEIIDKPMPLTEAPLSGIAVWPKVVCCDNMCFTLDTCERSFMTFNEDFEIYDIQHIHCHNMPAEYIFKGIQYENPMGVTLNDLLTIGLNMSQKSSISSETCGDKIWRMLN